MQEQAKLNICSIPVAAGRSPARDSHSLEFPIVPNAGTRPQDGRPRRAGSVGGTLSRIEPCSPWIYGLVKSATLGRQVTPS
jgi:hypothetical protein